VRRRAGTPARLASDISKYTGQSVRAADYSLNDLESNRLAGIFRVIWSNLCTRHIPDNAAPPKDSTSSADSTKPSPASATISKDYKSVYDLQREVLKHCPAPGTRFRRSLTIVANQQIRTPRNRRDAVSIHRELSVLQRRSLGRAATEPPFVEFHC
jgi:hypothetical protein